MRFLVILLSGSLLGPTLLADEPASSPAQPPTGPFHATGIKTGEVTDRTAIVWTRLTLRPERNPSDGPRVHIDYETSLRPRRRQKVLGVRMENNVTVRDLREAAPGTDGSVRVRYRPQGSEDWHDTAWLRVDPLRDFTKQFLLSNLEPATLYEMRVESRGVDGSPGASIDGSFRTAPATNADARVRFCVSTGQGNDDQDCPEGFKLYPSIERLEPSFFVHTGDIVYYDQLAKTVDLARYHWQRMYSWPTNIAFHRIVPSYFEKDDHDTWVNDCWPTMQTEFMHEFTFDQGQAIFLEQVPMGESTYRTFRWGRDLQIWLLEGRDFRSANTDPDGPEKTILGTEQKAWLQRTLADSDATFRMVISPTPMVGPDRSSKSDNHANKAFASEGNELRQFLSGQPRTVVICGDRHWQYHSVDPATGLREYSCGPASDPHAGGWKPDDFRPEYHRYLRVMGGFLAVTVEPEGENGHPTATFTFHDVDGNIAFTDILEAKP